MAEQARTVEVEGQKVPMVNAPYICISELVGKLAESAPFAVGWFQRSDGLYAYSLRSRGPDGVDVSEMPSGTVVADTVTRQASPCPSGCLRVN